MNKFILCAKRLAFIAVISILGSSFAFSERNIKIKISGENSKNNPVNLTLSSSSTERLGNILITTMNLIVANQSDRILEGELEFPLEEGESVIGYAIDVNGKLRKGVVVEKDKGRQVFEAVVRQGIDPGLIEKTSGNNFKTRVYPIPAKGLRQIQVTVQGIEKNPANFKAGIFTETIGKDTYFYSARQISAASRPKTLPKNLTVWWDVSSSGEKRNLESEIEFLKSYIKKLDAPKIAVYPFANEVLAGQVFEINGEKDLKSLENFIKNLEYDGATNLGFDWAKFGGDEILLFTDGLGNWDDSYGRKQGLAESAVPKSAQKGEIFKNQKSPSIYTINSSASADHAWLSSTAQKNGGVYVNLSALGKSSVQEKLSLMTSEPYRLIRAEYDSKAVGEIYPEEGSVVSGNFTLSGLLKKKNAEVKLHFGHGNNVEETVTVKLSSVGGIESKNVARLWASQKIDSLSKNYDKNKDEIISLAKKFSIVTKDTSLIVLDTANDYARYGIVPPKDDEKLYSEYEEIVARQGNSIFKPQNSEESGKIPESVYKTFKDFKKWWNTSLEDFKKQKEKKKKEGGIIRPLSLSRNNESRNEVFLDSLAEEDSELVYSDISEQAVSNEWTGTGNNPEVRAAAPMMMAKSAVRENPSASKPSSIQLQAWSPNAEYLSALKKCETAQMYQKYLLLKKDYGTSPAFYMEVSDYFAEEGLEAESIRILSNLSELELENTDILRALANKLVERKNYALAIPVFEKLVALKGEVPQFYRDLGMAYHLLGDEQKACETLYKVVQKKWDGRFDEVQQICLNDMNAIIAECERKKIKLDLSGFDKKLIQNFDVDVRIILTWNTDDCDIDLWVTDKDGEKCFYGNRITRNGARMSRDFTQGYGPEEFCIKTAPGGKLKIEANYYGNHQQKVLQPVTVQAEVYTNFGRENQKREVLTLQLNEVKGTFLIGEVEF